MDLKWWDLEKVWRLLESEEPLQLSDDAVSATETCYNFLQQVIKDTDADPIYGVNTGFGDLAHTRVSDASLHLLQRNILISHACGVGEDVPEPIVRAMLLLKIKSLSKGHSGVQLATVQRLLDHLNLGILPVVPSQGSLGASGDLAPLSHLVLPLIGEGEVHVEGAVVRSADLLLAKGWDPIHLGAKEGLALINGTQMMLGYGVMALRRLECISEWADVLCAWSLEAWHGRSEPFDPAIHEARNHDGAKTSAARIRYWVEGSAWQREARKQVQDPYSFRCAPQVHGASRHAIGVAREVFEEEINAVTDNPLIFPESGKILSGGNFHGQPLALQLDQLALAAHEWGSISERRTFKLLSGRQGLPAFLSPDPGLNSGFMIPQYTSAALVSQNKQLCMPASSDTIDSSNGQEDHVSMGANAALKLWRVLDNVEQVLAVECMSAAQAVDLKGRTGLAPKLGKLQDGLREHVPFLKEDAFMQPLMLATRDWMFSQDLDTPKG